MQAAWGRPRLPHTACRVAPVPDGISFRLCIQYQRIQEHRSDYKKHLMSVAHHSDSGLEKAHHVWCSDGIIMMHIECILVPVLRLYLKFQPPAISVTQLQLHAVLLHHLHYDCGTQMCVFRDVTSMHHALHCIPCSQNGRFYHSSTPQCVSHTGSHTGSTAAEVPSSCTNQQLLVMNKSTKWSLISNN